MSTTTDTKEFGSINNTSAKNCGSCTLFARSDKSLLFGDCPFNGRVRATSECDKFIRCKRCSR